MPKFIDIKQKSFVRCAVNNLSHQQKQFIFREINDHISVNVQNGGYIFEKNNLNDKQNYNLSTIKIAPGNKLANKILIPVVIYVNCPYASKKVINDDIDKFIQSLNDNYSGNVPIPSVDNLGPHHEEFQNYLKLKTPISVTFVKKNVTYGKLMCITESNTDLIDIIVKQNENTYIVPKINYGKVLNIWFVTFSNGLLGYSQFPWELKTKPYYDGVVLDYRTIDLKYAYGPYNLNRTAVHEIGHWFGLLHTFETTIISYAILNNNKDNSVPLCETTGDCICDTPPQIEPTYGNPFDDKYNKNPKNPLYSAWPTYNNTLSMFMNYMDYSDDAAMFMFTSEQATKIIILLNLYRTELVNLS